MIKPKALQKGDTIGIVAPSGLFDKKKFEKGIEFIKKIGFNPFWREDIFHAKRYMAGSDSRRVSELMDLFSNEEIKAIFCARGGYGAGRILPLLQKEKIVNHPKIFVGYSDICFLLNFFVQECSMVCFHGPMVAGALARGLSPYEEEVFIRLLTSKKPLGELNLDGIEVLREGIGEGILIGGCLSIIISSMGTEYELETKGKILFLEDTNEPLYRLDRMLTQMRIAGKFDKIEGIIFGHIFDPKEEVLFKEMAKEIFEETKAPVLYKVPAGHGNHGLALPFGVKVRVDANERKLFFLESAVS
jgi:muramoyltetrapeptide carboxypeptidase